MQEGVERQACAALSRVGCGKAHWEAHHAGARHGLIAETPTSRWITAKNEALLPDELIVRDNVQRVLGQDVLGNTPRESGRRS